VRGGAGVLLGARGAAAGAERAERGAREMEIQGAHLNPLGLFVAVL
jgi:hypothetical protein